MMVKVLRWWRLRSSDTGAEVLASCVGCLVPTSPGTAGRWRCSCVVRSGGRLDPFPWSDQIATASSVEAATTRSVVGSSPPSS